MEEDFWTRIEKEVDSRFPRKKVTKDLGIAPNSFTTWRTRETYPSAKVITDLAEKLGLTVEYLVTGNRPEIDLPWIESHKDLIEDLKMLPAEDLRKIGLQVKAVADDERSRLGKASALEKA